MKKGLETSWLYIDLTPQRGGGTSFHFYSFFIFEFCVPSIPLQLFCNCPSYGEKKKSRPSYGKKKTKTPSYGKYEKPNHPNKKGDAQNQEKTRKQIILEFHLWIACGGVSSSVRCLGAIFMRYLTGSFFLP